MSRKHLPIIRPRLLPVLIANLVGCGQALAEPVFELGTVQVTARKNAVGEVGEEQVSSLITQEEMRQFNRVTVGEAVNLLSGVTLAFSGARNETTVNIRGFDSRQTPLFIDGIPVYVPYDGNVDISRFTTFDLSAIQVAKGFSSVSYGPNVLGGAINLITRKPQRILEGDISAGFGEGHERRTAVNVGSNQGLWYVQAGASYRDSDYFRLSSDFQPTSRENGGRRENSYSEDQKLSFKLGLTPNARDEYALSYYKQDGVKGQPPSIDPSVNRFWQWPYWDKESLYFVSRTALGDKETFKARLFMDKFDNELRIYTNGSYSTLSGGAAGGISIYHDKTHGASFELSSVRLTDNELKLVTQYKVDKHQALNGLGVEDESFQDTLTTFAIEDNYRMTPELLLSAGLSHFTLNADKVFKSGANLTVPEKQSTTNGQVGLFYDFRPDTRFYLTVAQKTRLPTLKDRFSQRFSQYNENPDLKAEESVNYELGYQGTPWHGAKAEAAVFHSRVSDKIQRVLAPGRTTCGTTVATRCQMQNVGEVKITGLELGLRTPLMSWLDAGANFTYLNIENISNPTTKILDIPVSKTTVYALIRPLANVEVVPFIEYGSGRWASDTVRLEGFAIANLKVAYRPMQALTLEAGVSNLTDHNYYLADGYPNPGRMWFANANYRF